MASSTYLIAIGSNRRGRNGAPRAEVSAAIAALERVIAASPIIETPPLGPSIRRFANAACLVETDLPPDAMLARLKTIERRFGRRPGRRWGARVIDLDIILWSGGCWASPGLIIPHPAFRERGFVLAPARVIAPAWRDPLSGRTITQLHARLTRATHPPR